MGKLVSRSFVVSLASGNIYRNIEELDEKIANQLNWFEERGMELVTLSVNRAYSRTTSWLGEVPCTAVFRKRE